MFSYLAGTVEMSSFRHRLGVHPHRLIPDVKGAPMACGLRGSQGRSEKSATEACPGDDG